MGGFVYLLPSKDVLVEVKLDLLVGDVDAELLEGVLLEVFKTKNVQDADVEAFLRFSANTERFQSQLKLKSHQSQLKAQTKTSTFSK